MRPLGMSREDSACSTQSSISKYDRKNESTVLFDEDESVENSVLLKLVVSTALA